MPTRQPPNGTQSRVALLSPRNLRHEVWRAYHYEFENIICEIDNVELIAPGERRRKKLERYLRGQAGKWFSVAAPPPLAEQVELDRQYDLFFTVMVGPPDLDLLEACKGWRERSRVAACWIDEIWLRYLQKNRIKILDKFDFVFLACEATVPALRKEIGPPLNYIAPGVDALRFCPYPDPPDRTIDVYSIGRRVEDNHRVLTELAQQRRLHYVFDTAPVRSIHCAFDHRMLLANQIQRSRFFCVDVAKVNVPGHRGQQEEMGYRFFEGAAGGALLVGRAPQCRSFAENFDWADAVIERPESASEWAEFFERHAEGERIEHIRRNNIDNCLRRHDWVYRWQTILEAAGMQHLELAERRMRQLMSLSTTVNEESLVAG